jgi:hypothetical protein
MAQSYAAPPTGVSVWRQHWPVLLTGLGLAAAAAVLSFGSGEPALARLVLMGAGLILAAQAVILRIRQGREEAEERVESAAVVALAGFAALLGVKALHDWDSATMVMWGLIVAAACGVVLVLLPAGYRRVAASALAVFHFVGIFTVVTMLPPPVPRGSAPFLANEAWMNVYRPYLETIFMHNAYHFYSPEPGPPTLLWFKLNYVNENGPQFKVTPESSGALRAMDVDKDVVAKIEMLEGREFATREQLEQQLKKTLSEDQLKKYQEPVIDQTWNVKSEWFKMPKREDSPVSLHYQRLLSITESCNGVVYQPPIGTVQLFMPRRLAAGRLHDIPTHPGEAVDSQFQAPDDRSGRMIPSVVRRVAREKAHHSKDPSATLVSIKMYRVRRQIIQPGEMADGFDALDDWHNLGFYLGEYFPDGKNVNRKDDPYLYWLIPVIPNTVFDPSRGLVTKPVNYLEKHADIHYNRKFIETAWKEHKP